MAGQDKLDNILDLLRQDQSSILWLEWRVGEGKSTSLLKSLAQLGGAQSSMKVMVTQTCAIAAALAHEYLKSNDRLEDLSQRTELIRYPSAKREFTGDGESTFLTCTADAMLQKFMCAEGAAAEGSDLWNYTVIVIGDIQERSLAQEVIMLRIKDLQKKRDQAGRPVHFILQSVKHTDGFGEDIKQYFDIPPKNQFLLGASSSRKPRLQFLPVKEGGTRAESILMQAAAIIEHEKQVGHPLGDLGILVFIGGSKDLRDVRSLWEKYLGEAKTGVASLIYFCTRDRDEKAAALLGLERKPKLILVTNSMRHDLSILKIQHVIIPGFKTVPVFDPVLGEEVPRDVVLSRTEVQEQLDCVAGAIGYLLFSNDCFVRLPTIHTPEFIVRDCFQYMAQLHSIFPDQHISKSNNETRLIAWPPANISALAVTRLIQRGCLMEARNDNQRGYRLEGLFDTRQKQFNHNLSFDALNLISLLKESDSSNVKRSAIELACVLTTFQKEQPAIFHSRTSKSLLPLSAGEIEEAESVDDVASPTILGDLWKDVIHLEKALNDKRMLTGQKHWKTQEAYFNDMADMRLDILQASHLADMNDSLGRFDGVDEAVLLQKILQVFKFRLVKVTSIERRPGRDGNRKRDMLVIMGLHLASGRSIRLWPNTILSIDQESIDEGLYVVYGCIVSEAEPYVVRGLFRIPTTFLGVQAPQSLESFFGALRHEIKLKKQQSIGEDSEQ